MPGVAVQDDLARSPTIYVLAGVNGAGKSSIGGAAFRSFGADYYNPDEAARALMTANPGLGQREANATAWEQGKRLLEQAIAKHLHFAFETTLSANTIPRLLAQAASRGIESHIWYVGLAGPELHIARVHARVRKGGHDIPEVDIRRRYEHSRLNLIHLLPTLTALRVYDNSAEADPDSGKAPTPWLVLHMARGTIVGPPDLSQTPDWAKPIVAAGMKLHSG
ncbi:MAG: zeta toxin family protein [Gammaproteobacteria bacterium]